MITSEQYHVLSALAAGRACTLWPMMRRAFLRARWIRPSGAAPLPTDAGRPTQLAKPYEVTDAGHAALAEHAATRESTVTPTKPGPLKMVLVKGVP